MYEYTCAYENIFTSKCYQNTNKQTKDTILKLLPGVTQCHPPKTSHFPFRYSFHLWDRVAESWSHPETLCQPPGNMLPLPLRMSSLILASADRKISSQKPRQDSNKPGVHNTCLLWNQHRRLSSVPSALPSIVPTWNHLVWVCGDGELGLCSFRFFSEVRYQALQSKDCFPQLLLDLFTCINVCFSQRLSFFTAGILFLFFYGYVFRIHKNDKHIGST